MNLDKVFDSFCENLQSRTELMTEDNVRYYWFASMLEQDNDLDHYTMEYPYDSSEFKKSSRVAKKELDFLYLNGEDSYCMEIKFHRNPDPRSTFAHTDAAGSLFNDIIRLSFFTPGKSFEQQRRTSSLPASTRRLFLYVTDAEMDDYLRAANNYSLNLEYRSVLREFYNMENGQQYKAFSFKKTPGTFSAEALWSLNEKYNVESIPSIRLLYKNKEPKIEMKSESFKNGQCHVRLYEVLSQQ